MKKFLLSLGLVPALLVGGCDDGSQDDEMSADESSTTGMTSSSTDSGSTTGTTGTTGTTTGGDEGVPQCSPWADDCLEGTKCMPYDRPPVEAIWDANGCFPLANPAGMPGDACTVYESAVDGLDNCAEGSMCMPSDFNDLSLGGTCIAFCEGSPEAPHCADPENTCLIANDGALNLCLTACDPTAQDCPPGEGCYLNPTDNKFFCSAQDESAAGNESGYAASCGTLNYCDPGLQCDVGAKVPGTCGDYCCTEYCDLTAPDADEMCAGFADGQRCVAHYPGDSAPTGFEHIGLCAIPT